MVSVHVHVLNTNLCKEVTGGSFYLFLYSYYMYGGSFYLFFLYSYYIYVYEIYRSVLQRGGGQRKVYLLGASACRRPHIFNIYPSMAKNTTIL